MKTTALHDRHAALGARFAPFAGFDMPIQYPLGALEEHRLTRRSVGLFDIAHMGRFVLEGPGAGAYLSRMTSNRLLDLRPGEARYTLLLDEGAGILDDLFVYRLGNSSIGSPGGEDAWLVVANASNKESDFSRLRDGLPAGVDLSDRSEELYMIAVQGPRAIEVLDSLSGGRVSPIPRSASEEAEVAGVRALVGRTGYTGEDGVELFFPASQAVRLWDEVLGGARKLGVDAGPVGLAARDSLRFEAGMPLHGHEIGVDTAPAEALLSWACDFDKDFVGREAALRYKEAPRRKLVTLTTGGGVPRQGYPVHDPTGREVGVCVSGMFCPTVGVFAANAFVEPSLTAVGTELAISIRGKAVTATVTKRPLYLPTYRKRPNQGT